MGAMTPPQVPSVEEIWMRLRTPQATALMIPLSLVSGDVFMYLEAHGTTSLRRLIRELEWSAPMVMMAVGTLVREGLVHATPHDLDVIVEVHEPIQRPHSAVEEVVPEMWAVNGKQQERVGTKYIRRVR